MDRDENIASNIEQLSQMLKEAEKKIVLTKMKTINLLGKTGVGKSTVLCVLSEYQPMLSINKSDEIILDFYQEGDSKIAIGHTSTSCTTLPNFKNICNNIYWDCPGFCDNKSIIQEIVNLFCIKRIFDSASEYKIVLVIEYESIISVRGNDLAETFKLLVEMFPEQNKLFNSLSIIITKCGNHRYTSQFFVKYLEKMAQDNNEFLSSRPLINLITKTPERVAIFKKPENESDINDILRNELKSSISHSNYVKMQTRNSLSDKARLAIGHLITHYEREIEVMMNEFAKSLILKFRSEKNMSALKEGKQALDRFSEQFANGDYDVKKFETNFIKLAEYFTGSEALLSKIKNLTYRIEFYNDYRNANSQPINLSTWICPMLEAKSEIESCIDFNNEVNARKQVEQFSKENDGKIKILNEQISSMNRNYEEHLKIMEEFQRINANRNEANSKMIAEIIKSNNDLMVAIANRPPIIVEESGGICSIF
ncbi:hypothetical protein SteCoe_35082 [Stentor coeruleus]|uniref:G domain-containing protein n=1 Tax=Stentor coeruleus TaxID=5963 RepID=A0A1R2AT76_9CILI|nr:hypothetical protein SteCoe_35082 [Stentor coeruleus]